MSDEEGTHVNSEKKESKEKYSPNNTNIADENEDNEIKLKKTSINSSNSEPPLKNQNDKSEAPDSNKTEEMSNTHEEEISRDESIELQFDDVGETQLSEFDEEAINEDEKDLEESDNIEDNENSEDEESIRKELLEFAEMDEFSDLSEDDLLDIQEALKENKAEIQPSEESLESKFGISKELQEALEIEPEVNASEEELETEDEDDLEAKVEAELEKQRKEKASNQVSREDFIQYLSKRRTKIIYHALWYLIFNVDDHQASKQLLYDQLKEATSKDPVEPLEEHKFYFGLGFILRLKYNRQRLIQFRSGKLQFVGNVEDMKSILQIVGDPISERPILTQKEQEKMFTDFLDDDFEDI